MKLKVAILGAGRNGSTFVEYYKDNPHVAELVVVEPNPKLRDRYHGFPKVVNTYEQAEDFFDHDGADLVSIHTPSDLHAPHFLRAAALGTHIFVEKPLANTQADIETMLEAAKKNKNKKMMVGQNYRQEAYNPQIKKFIEEGAVGEPVCLYMGYVTDYLYVWQDEQESNFGSLTSFARKVRPMIEGACHLVDLANWLTGSRPQTVFARKRPMPADQILADWMAGIFHYADKTLVHIDASWAAIGPIKDNYGVEVYGTEGTIRDGRLYRYSSREYHLRRFEERPMKPDQRREHAYGEEVRSLIESIVEDKPVPVTMAEGANAAIGAIAAEDSARLEKMIQVPFYKDHVEENKRFIS